MPVDGVRAAARTPSLATSRMNVVVAAGRADGHLRVGSACWSALRSDSARTDCASGSRCRRDVARALGLDGQVRVQMRRGARSSSASVAPVGRDVRPERALDDAAQVRERALDLGGSAAARARRELAAGVQRHRHAEQALDDAVVDVARHVDAVLRARARARPRRSRCAPSPPAPRSCRASTARGARTASSGASLVRSHSTTPIQRFAATTGTQKRHLPWSSGAYALGHLALERRRGLDDLVGLQRAARDRGGFDRHLRAFEDRQVHAVAAGRAHAAHRLVVAEEDRSVHVAQAADDLAQPAVERVGRGRRRRPRRGRRRRHRGPKPRQAAAGRRRTQQLPALRVVTPRSSPRGGSAPHPGGRAPPACRARHTLR